MQSLDRCVQRRSNITSFGCGGVYLKVPPENYCTTFTFFHSTMYPFKADSTAFVRVTQVRVQCSQPVEVTLTASIVHPKYTFSRGLYLVK